MTRLAAIVGLLAALGFAAGPASGQQYLTAAGGAFGQAGGTSGESSSPYAVGPASGRAGAPLSFGNFGDDSPTGFSGPQGSSAFAQLFAAGNGPAPSSLGSYYTPSSSSSSSPVTAAALQTATQNNYNSYSSFPFATSGNQFGSPVSDSYLSNSRIGLATYNNVGYQPQQTEFTPSQFTYSQLPQTPQYQQAYQAVAPAQANQFGSNQVQQYNPAGGAVTNHAVNGASFQQSFAPYAQTQHTAPPPPPPPPPPPQTPITHSGAPQGSGLPQALQYPAAPPPPPPPVTNLQQQQQQLQQQQQPQQLQQHQLTPPAHLQFVNSPHHQFGPADAVASRRPAAPIGPIYRRPVQAPDEQGYAAAAPVRPAAPRSLPYINKAQLSYDAAAPAGSLAASQLQSQAEKGGTPDLKDRPPAVHPPAPVHYVSIGEKLEGDYRFGYETGKGSNGDESFRTETRDADGTVRGSYGYVDPTGKKITVHYEAGVDGFRILTEDEVKSGQARKRPFLPKLDRQPSAPAPAPVVESSDSHPLPPPPPPPSLSSQSSLSSSSSSEAESDAASLPAAEGSDVPAKPRVPRRRRRKLSGASQAQ